MCRRENDISRIAYIDGGVIHISHFFHSYSRQCFMIVRLRGGMEYDRARRAVPVCEDGIFLIAVIGSYPST